jgi:cysteine-rich repeat protein
MHLESDKEIRGEYWGTGSLFLSLAGIFAVILFFFTLDQPHVVADNVATSIYISICSNGVVDTDELCDDGAGNNIGGYGSTTAERKCESDCQNFGPYCGDGTLQVRFSEACDDGNSTSGDLCSNTCTTETAVNQTPTGSPTVGGVAQVPGGVPGQLPSALETKVVLRGKAYPQSRVTILLDGKTIGSAQADSNADFLFSTTNVTPGTATFSFLATDPNGVNSIMSSAVFEVVQAAVTTVANIFLPPTISVSKKQTPPGELLTLSGLSVPNAKVVTSIDAISPKSTYDSTASEAGAWALQIDTKSLKLGNHTAKAYFQVSETIKSGYGRALSFNIGTEPLLGEAQPDLNGDGKVNLVDFSIFLLAWQSDDSRSDFNKDGIVNLADFSMLLFSWTG